MAVFKNSWLKDLRKCITTMRYWSFHGNLSNFSERLWFTSFLNPWLLITAQKMNFSTKDFFSKCDQIRSKLWNWSNLLNNALVENFILVQWINADSEIKEASHCKSLLLISEMIRWNGKIYCLLGHFCRSGKSYFQDISIYFLYVVKGFTKPAQKCS